MRGEEEEEVAGVVARVRDRRLRDYGESGRLEARASALPTLRAVCGYLQSRSGLRRGGVASRRVAVCRRSFRIAVAPVARAPILADSLLALRRRVARFSSEQRRTDNQLRFSTRWLSCNSSLPPPVCPPRARVVPRSVLSRSEVHADRTVSQSRRRESRECRVSIVTYQSSAFESSRRVVRDSNVSLRRI